MPKLTAKYFKKLLEAREIELFGYYHARRYHADRLKEMSAEDIQVLAHGLVLGMSKIDTGDPLFRAMGMARFYREFANGQKAAA